MNRYADHPGAMSWRQPGRPDLGSRGAFTLIELIVVIAVLLILLVFTAGAVNYAMDAEKVGGGARQVQSYLAGARDRAIHSKQLRGVRFVRDLDNPAIVSSLMFVGPSEPWSEGNIRLERVPGARFATVVAASPDSGWWELAARRTFYERGLRIRIPNDRSGSWYTVIAFNNSNGVWSAPVPPVFNPNDSDTSNDDPFPLKIIISPPYRDPATNPVGEVQAFAGGGPNTYQLELPNVILPERPVLLPKGTVVDLLASDIPDGWPTRTSLTSNVPAFMDVMFSPRGSVVGDAASKGVLHFYVTELTSVDVFRDYLSTISPPPLPNVPAEEVPDGNGGTEPIGDRALVSLFTQTGSVSSHPIDVTDLDGDFIADDPYYFAETGEVLDQ